MPPSLSVGLFLRVGRHVAILPGVIALRFTRVALTIGIRSKTVPNARTTLLEWAAIMFQQSEIKTTKPNFS
jgi:hypothetical protein